MTKEKLELIKEKINEVFADANIENCIYVVYQKISPCSRGETFDEYTCQGCEDDCDAKRIFAVKDFKARSIWQALELIADRSNVYFATKEEAEEYATYLNEKYFK